VVRGANVDMICRTTVTDTPGLAGVSTFHGAADGAGIVGGSCTRSRFPGANGIFAMMRVEAGNFTPAD